MKEEPAISVVDEAANVYYKSYMDMPKDVRRDLSCHHLHNVFKYMVKPAIERARSLDRQGISEGQAQGENK